MDRGTGCYKEERQMICKVYSKLTHLQQLACTIPLILYTYMLQVVTAIKGATGLAGAMSQ